MAGIAEFVLSPTFLILAPLLLVIGNVASFVLRTLRPKGFPPGPAVVPGLGNLSQIDKRFPFRSYGTWAGEFGRHTPLGIKKAANNVVVLNSGRLVRELFEKRGAVYSDRPWQYINNEWILGKDLRLALFTNNTAWLTRWRREFSHIFDMAAITRFRPVYEAETARLLVKLVEAPQARRRDLEDILVCWIVSVPCLGLCGRRPDDLGDLDFNVKQFRFDQEQYLSLLTPGAGDVFPLLRYLPEAFGLAPWKEKARYHPDMQKRARDEVLQVFAGAPPRPADLAKLKFVEAFYNEAAAHAPSQDDVFEGHAIPKGTSVIANVWHIHHSADDYDDPDKFIPERFLAHPFGMRPDAAHDPARLEGSGPRLTYAFGAGRRICPGMDSARQSLVLGLAKVLWAFDVLPPDNGDEIDLDIETGFISDLALRPRRFDVSLKLREGRTKEEILDHYHQAYEGQAEVMGWEGGLYR
ncbi:cytochrome P450 [Lasiosphaeria ovina]|uniref:Cytochrome P450 n=1 Tax=Lasiosphaeria ovina TaxID=92902 RepID=A0AAE0JUU9_9PEZI|nr:cytochrome P450 [Lasiosphaeria ovina]